MIPCRDYVLQVEIVGILLSQSCSSKLIHICIKIGVCLIYLSLFDLNNYFLFYFNSLYLILAENLLFDVNITYFTPTTISTKEKNVRAIRARIFHLKLAPNTSYALCFIALQVTT